MNCRRVNDLIAPYVDERLTGQQMLEVRRHLDNCPSCSREHLEQRQAKIMMRRLAMKKPDAIFETRLYAQIEVERQSSVLALSFPNIPFMQGRGRRMAYAFALSCVTVLSLAHATSQNMAKEDAPSRPVAMDAEMSNGILTDLEGQNITNAFRGSSTTPLQAAFFGVRRPSQPRPRRTYDLVGGFSAPVSMYSSATSFAVYSTH